MSLDVKQSMMLRLANCCPVPASFPDEGKITWVNDAYHAESINELSESPPAPALEPAIKVEQQITPKMLIRTFVRPDDVCALRTVHEKSYRLVMGTDQIEQLLTGANGISGTLFIKKSAAILTQHEVASSASDESFSPIDFETATRSFDTGGADGCKICEGD